MNEFHFSWPDAAVIASFMAMFIGVAWAAAFSNRRGR